MMRQYDVLLQPASYGFDKKLLSHRCIKAVNKARMLQGTKHSGKTCPLPGCRRKVANILHSRTACTNMEQSKKITDCANQQVWTIANTIGKGNLGRWRLLVNAGIKYAPVGYAKFLV
jgi:hypothetical protein